VALAQDSAWHTSVLVLITSDGQSWFVPSQFSATSQVPTAGRQTFVLGFGVKSQPLFTSQNTKPHKCFSGSQRELSGTPVQAPVVPSQVSFTVQSN
jgi:hypothetical protein